MENTIPKIIHQIWIGPNPQPYIWTDTFSKDYVNNNPEWEYKLWTENNIGGLLSEFPVLRRIFDAEKEYYGKADILRYAILYTHGGVYIDADIVWVNNKSLNPIIESINCFFHTKLPKKT
jgi:mannosyltransferase OCH1-like enzyme